MPTRHDDLIEAAKDGHDWCDPKRGGLMLWPYCARCLTIKRRDGKNAPCKGPAKLREPEKLVRL